MKTIKIAYVGFWGVFNPTDNILYEILKKHYDVQITAPEDAEYIICSVFGNEYNYCKYPQVRIMWSVENYIPDFNLVDYAICSYPLQFLDRSVYYPMYAQRSRFRSFKEKSRDYSLDILQSKPYFANFIASHESEYGIRGDFFKELCKYKKVESPGSYLNNRPDVERFWWASDEKPNFQRKCKFSLCFESTKNEGFVTEKIVDAFFADTIPVYYGSDTVKSIFNEKAFINVSDYPNFDAVIEKIKELDQDDEKYMEMLRQPILCENIDTDEYLVNLENFLCNIFDQSYEKAYRRSRVHAPKRHENFLLEALKKNKKSRKSIIKKIYRKLFR